MGDLNIKIEKGQDSKYGARTGNDRGEKMGLMVGNKRPKASLKKTQDACEGWKTLEETQNT